MEQIRNHSKGVATNTIKSLIGVALIKAGVNTVDHTSKYNRKDVARCHGFRKFFTTVWTNSKLKLNPERREMLLGHKIGLASCYYRPTQDDLLREYLKAVDDLTINEENRLKIKVQQLEGESNEIQNLKKQMNENSAMLNDVLELIKLRIKEDNIMGWESGEYEKHSNKVKTIDKRLSQKGIEARKLIGSI
jgi:hypothetical protein